MILTYMTPWTNRRRQESPSGSGVEAMGSSLDMRLSRHAQLKAHSQ